MHRHQLISGMVCLLVAGPLLIGCGEPSSPPADPCATDNGGCAQRCASDATGSFDCTCDAGWRLGADGLACDDIDECATGNGGCEQVCTNSAGSFECTCDAGWQLAAGESACEDVDECATSNGGCEQTCTNSPGSFECTCELGWDLSTDGLGCERDVCISVCEIDEQCEDPGTAIDNDCDGVVDEGCMCTPGLRQACFRGDPAFAESPECFSGYQECEAGGMWGPCNGGAHATDACHLSDRAGCHTLSSAPFVPVHLADGIGDFGDNALSFSWSVTCPRGVSPCPVPTALSPTGEYRPMQSGEYLVTYNKTTSAGSDSCTYPLRVGARGLRIELDWEHNETDSGVDLDLHVHQPNDTSPWGGSGGNAVDCAWDNCTANAHSTGTDIDWFSGAAPPEPVGWYLDPVFENNTCFFAPRSAGAAWQSLGMGCHNPRLDVDNVTCDATVTDPQDSRFCSPENINIDFPPVDAWTRIGVHYYSSHGETYDVHPRVRIFCDGSLAAELGPSGFSEPESPVTFSPADSDSRFWLVADVAYVAGTCGGLGCVVRPLYDDAATRTPVLSTVAEVQASFGPPYPAP